MPALTTPPPPPTKGPESEVGVLSYCLLCLNVFFFGYLAVAAPSLYDALAREDNWVENLTAVWFLLGGILLGITALAERNFLLRCIYVLGGIALVFVAGEEISWGQRIFGLATPDFLIGLNSQDELNVHNIGTKTFTSIYSYGERLPLLLCTLTGAVFLSRKDRLFGIPLPSILLMLGFILMLSQRQGSLKSIQWFSFYNEQFLVLFLFIYALVSRQTKLGVATASAIVLVLVLLYVNDTPPNNSVNEVREYLLGFVSLFYAGELLLAQEPARRKIVAIVEPFNALKLRPGRIPVLLTVCSLVIVSSIGLAFFNYLSVSANADAIAEDHRSIISGELGEPAIRSSFDVYLIENRLIYFKEICAPADTEESFFLHIVPADANDLPGNRRQYGFDNYGFVFDRHRRTARLDGSCLVSNPLPDYGIANIRTGQYISSSGEIWSGSIVIVRTNDAIIAAAYQSIIPGELGEPAIRSSFDVYLVENRLIYFKEICAPADTEESFFLHIVPADADDLPGNRRQYGFDNYGFVFGKYGSAARLDGSCLAAIPLPDYGIASIRTGQYISGSGEIWSGSIVLNPDAAQ